MGTSMYGRYWKLDIKCADGATFTLKADGFKTGEMLKCTFDINYPGYDGWFVSEFNIWNTNYETQKKIIESGAEVYFSAGYSDGRQGQIFGGDVFQVMYTRENVTDNRLTLVCVDGSRLYSENFTLFTLGQEYTEATLTNAVASRAIKPVEVNSEELPPEMDEIKFPRGRTVFGSPSTVVREVTRNARGCFYMDKGQLNIFLPTDEPGDEIVDVNPESGLIGTPIQIENGIRFRTLLNPFITLSNPPKWVKVDLSKVTIQQQRAQIGKDLISKLPKDGYFQIGGIRHTGDSRGNDWYTDVVGYSLAGAKAGSQLTVPGMKRISEKVDQTGGSQ